MAGLFVALLLELLDPVVRTRRDALGIPGVELAWEFQQVPEGHYTLIDAAEPGEPVAVLFRRLINDLDAKLKPEDWTCLGVASVEAQAGRTLVATNLAQVLAMKEYQVILVDADLRPVAGTRPAELFGIPASAQGLLQALYGEVPIAEVCMVKNLATQCMELCAKEGVQILGGAGFIRGVKSERIYRETKVLSIGGGAEEIMKELAARQLGYLR
jgi:acyl-CoA dehydrogenase